MEYAGPVFIIKQMDADKGVYDAFITTGGIQVVMVPVPPPPPPQSKHFLPHRKHPATGASPAAAASSTNSATGGAPIGSEEDSEYFGVLVTPDAVRQFDAFRSASLNVTLSTLLNAVSSRMPWMLVLQRAKYPELFAERQPQQQLHQQQLQRQLPLSAPGGVPDMEIPQRRRYHSERQRRGLFGHDWRDAYGANDAAEQAIPMALERQLLSTMCYNFVLDYSAASDSDGAAGANPSMRPGEPPAYPSRVPVTVRKPMSAPPHVPRTVPYPPPPQDDHRTPPQAQQQQHDEQTSPTVAAAAPVPEPSPDGSIDLPTPQRVWA